MQGCLSGLRPAVVGLIAASVISVGATVFFSGGVTRQVVGTPPSALLWEFSWCLWFSSFGRCTPLGVILLSGLLGIGAGLLGLFSSRRPVGVQPGTKHFVPGKICPILLGLSWFAPGKSAEPAIAAFVAERQAVDR